MRLSHVGRAAFLVRFSSLLPRCRHVRACLGSGILLASAALVVACDALAAPPFFRPLSRRAKTKVYMGDGGMRMRRPLGGAQSCNEATFERSGGLNPVELIKSNDDNFAQERINASTHLLDGLIITKATSIDLLLPEHVSPRTEDTQQVPFVTYSG